jgi:hypothetical protein
LAVACDADCRELRRRATEGGKEVAQFLIRKHMDDLDFMEVITTLGHQDWVQDYRKEGEVRVEEKW